MHWLSFLAGIVIGAGFSSGYVLWCVVKSSPYASRPPRDRVRIGAHSIIACRIELLTPEATVTIGEYCYIGPDTLIAAVGAITIGNRVQIAHRCVITDAPTWPEHRRNPVYGLQQGD